MFTGLVQEVGRVAATSRSGGNLRLTIEAGSISAELGNGSSICVNGVCLTVVRPGRRFEVEVSKETASRTTLSSLRSGAKVNLETPVKPSSFFGGHFVTGHVDSTARLESIKHLSGSEVWRIAIPAGIARYIVEKGSIAVDGISLTVASIESGALTVALIPHTLKSTTLKNRRPGDILNIEADILAKHVEKLIGKAKETIQK
jgi:riboflavin synthase